MGAKVSTKNTLPEPPEEIIEYEGYEEFPVIEIAKNVIIKNEKVRPNPSLNNHSGGSSIGKYESENYINKNKDKTENNEEENKLKEDNNIDNNISNDNNIVMNNIEEVKEPEIEDEKLKNNNIKENIEERKMDENNENGINGNNENNVNNMNENMKINFDNGISEIKEEDINYNENEEKEKEKSNEDLNINNNDNNNNDNNINNQDNINNNINDEYKEQNNKENNENINTNNIQENNKEIDKIEALNENKENQNDNNINQNITNNNELTNNNNKDKKNNESLLPKKIILPEIESIISEKVLKEGAGNELLFMSYLNKIVHISMQDKIKYSNKFCISSKDNFLIYENRENYIQVKKPLAIIPISSIKDVVLFKLSKKVITYDHFYIEFELNEENRNNVYNKIDTFYENNLDNKTNENLKNTALVMFKAEEKDLAKEWYVLLKYLINLQVNK